MNEKIEKALGSLDDCVAYAKAVAVSAPLRDREWRKALATLRAALEDYEKARPLIEAAMKVEQIDFDAADDVGILTDDAEGLFDAALAYRQSLEGKEK